MDEAVELAELRRRAYGPGGAIDAAGIARLSELEGRTRASTDAVPTAAIAPTPAAAPEGARDAEPPSEASGPTPEATARRWPWIAGALLAGLLIGGGLSTAVAQGGPQPDDVLRIVDEDRPVHQDVPADAVMHERYHDLDIRSWTDPTMEGFRCLAVLPPEPAQYTWTACAPQSLSVVLDGRVHNQIQDDSYPFLSERVGDAPEGTIFRLELADDVVKVWRVDPPVPTRAQAG